MTNALDRILAYKRDEVTAAKAARSVAALEADAAAAGAPRGFAAKLEEVSARDGMALIAEIKKASPSAGLIAENFDPAEIAQLYERGGAAALSVLTDRQFFQGSLDDLFAARTAVGLPVLRKDFTLDRYHLLQASANGADCVLLIVAALEDEDLADLLAYARELKLDALVEVHDAAELDRALAVEADMIGVTHWAPTIYRPTVSINPDNINVASTSCNAFIQNFRCYIDHRINTTFENFLI